MKRFLRENLMIVVSIALPLLVVGAFALATLLPRALVEPPTWDLVLAVDAWQPQAAAKPRRVVVDVSEGQLRAHVFALSPGHNDELPRLFEYRAADGSVHEIEIVVPVGVEPGEEGTEVVVPELAGRPLITTLTAPDGWQFDASRSAGGGLFRELFGSGSRRQPTRISKRGAILEIELPSETPYSYYGVRFLGWVERRG
ncbi:MAG: hypothetical protein H6748_16630 [Spirochaetaceae bacterium]|nr:hypothetical protein [Myxococcales bacterium]MCB9725675.1 hypothetical protein [Spirochaetaceae bacterium]